jgi:hypothetical protein
MNTGLIFGCILIGTGIYMIVNTILHNQRYKLLQSIGIKVFGEVTEIKVDEDFLDVTIEYQTKEGYKIKEKIESIGKDSYKIGQKIDILLDENSPKIFLIDLKNEAEQKPNLRIFIAIFDVIVGLFLILFNVKY